jgi:hypothetical protein
MKKSRILAGAAVLSLALVLFATVNVRPAESQSPAFPDRVTRAQAAKMLVTWRGLTVAQSRIDPPSFSDLNAADAGQVGAVVAARWMDGYPDGTFRPQAWMTREQVAIVVVRSLALDGAAESLTVYQVDDALSGFVDDVAVSPNARPYVALALRKGLLAGDGGRLFPLDPLTRAQFSLVLSRADSLPPAVLKSSYTSEERALATFVDTFLFLPHHSPITGEMVLRNATNYGIAPLAQLVILAAETSLGDPDLGGVLARRNNFGCLRYHGAATPWGLLSDGSVRVAGKDWYSFATPAAGMAAFGRYLKAAGDGFYLTVLGSTRINWQRFAAVYYGRGVSGYATYANRLYSIERHLRAQAAEQGLVL